MRPYEIRPDGTVWPPILSAAQVADIMGEDESTIRRKARQGHIPNVHADDPWSTRLGVPAWWVTHRLNTGRPVCPCGCNPSARPSVVVGRQNGAAVTLTATADDGGPHLRTIGGDTAPPAA